LNLKEMNMETPVQIDFQGFVPTETQKAAVRQHVELFEKKFDRIISGRIVVKGPGDHRHTGGLYEINIRLRLPTGKEVDVSRTPGADERYSDFDFALNDTFKRARRQLQDRVRRLQGNVKRSEPQLVGTITKLFEDHGFLENEEGQEIYFHKNSVLGGAFSRLRLGTRVVFVEEAGEKGPQASTVKLWRNRRAT
jgi:cold shock CspA family protein/ribosome-associated translation inhibitor RaiA